MKKISRKIQILNAIDEFTSSGILNNSFNFEDSNAFTISIDLGLDRSNVSRIMNTLHAEGKLIKIEGRPTVYVSKQIIEDSFKYLSIPNTLEKGDDIKNYISLAQSNAISIKESLNMTGHHPNNSLYQTTVSLLSLILYKGDYKPVCFVSGENGVGKQHLINLLFNHAVQIGAYPKDSEIYYINLDSHWTSSRNIFDMIDPNIHKLIIVSTMSPIEQFHVSNLVKDFDYYYTVHHSNRPQIIFLISAADFITVASPYSFHIPSLKDRSSSELVELSLNILYLQAVSLQRDISITSKALQNIAAFNYENNISELKDELVYAITTIEFNRISSNNNLLELDVDCFSSRIGNNRKVSAELNDLIQSLPPIIRISYNNSFEQISKLIYPKNSNLLGKTSNKERTKIISLRDFLLDAPLTFPVLEKSTDIEVLKYIHTHAHDTILSSDPSIINSISSIFDEFLNNRIEYAKYKLNDCTSIVYDSNFTKKVNYLLEKRMPKLMDSEKIFINTVINQSFSFVKAVTIPAIVIHKNIDIAVNYAEAFNILLNNRQYYALSYPKNWNDKGSAEFSSNLIATVKQLNRGNGVLLIIDKPSLTQFVGSTVLDLKIPVFSIYPTSYLLMLHLSNVLKQNNESAISITKKMIENKKTKKQFLKSNSLSVPSNRAVCPYLSEMKNIFKSLNIVKTNELFYKLLLDISKDINIQINNEVILTFIFTGNSVLQKILTERRSKDNVIEHLSLEQESIIGVIKKSISSSPELKSLQFVNNDYLMFLDCIFEQVTSQVSSE